MDKFTDFCVSAARFYRSLNKPIIDSDIDTEFSLKADEDAQDDLVHVKIKGKPKIKLLDFIFSFFGFVFAFNLIFAAIRFIKKLFR